MATESFQAVFGNTTLTRSKVDVYAAYLNVSGETIPTDRQTLHVRYSTDSSFSTYIDVTFSATMATSSMIIWRNYEITGLHSDTTYYWLAWCGNLPTVDRSASGNFTTLEGITITGGSLSPSTVKLGDSVSMSWSCSGNKGDSGSWNFCSTTSSSYVSPTKFKTVSQDSTSPQSWTPTATGELYIWVWHYDGDALETSNIYCIGKLTITEEIVTKARIYSDGQWKPATPYIYDGEDWVLADAKVYSGGFK